MSNSGIYPALSGATAETQALDVLANNMANSASAGFRAQRLGFREVLSRAQLAKGSLRTPDQRFVAVTQSTQDPTAGPLHYTGQSTDLSVSGPGFLAVQTPAGARYLHSTSVIHAADGKLLTTSGQALIDVDNKPVQLPPGDFSISTRGEVIAAGKLVATLKIAEFPDPTRLQPVGNGLMAAPAGTAAQAPAQSQILPGYLESANVSPLRTMTDVITTSRHYEAMHRVIETFREIDTTAAHDIGSVT